jgi:hypothetical protein
LTTSSDAEIDGLVKSFKPEIGAMAAEVIAAIRDLRPDLAPRVRLGWGSVNFRHPQAGFVCGVFPMPDHVSLVFEHGRQLDSPLLQGEGKQVRFIRFPPGASVPRDALAVLLAEAIALRA